MPPFLYYHKVTIHITPKNTFIFSPQCICGTTNTSKNQAHIFLIRHLQYHKYTYFFNNYFYFSILKYWSHFQYPGTSKLFFLNKVLVVSPIPIPLQILILIFYPQSQHPKSWEEISKSIVVGLWVWVVSYMSCYIKLGHRLW